MRTLRKALGLSLILVAVFCASLYLFYKRAESKLARRPLILTPAVLNRPLPKSNLRDISGEPLADEQLRRGKVVLVFMMPDCKPCDGEHEFLRTVAGARPDVRFIYVIPFGNREQTLELARRKYALEPFFDTGSALSRELQLNQVPVKIFLDDGVIKKTWPDAALDDWEQAEFRDWLGGV